MLMPLPKLPRSKKAKSGASGLPRMERQTTPAETPGKVYAEDDEVQQAPGGWGGAVWFETTDPRTSVGGVCCRCGKLCKAVSLRYIVGPFGEWEGWTCFTCRKGARGMERTSNAGRLHQDKVSKMAQPVPQGESERIYWAGVRKLEIDEIITWEGEGGNDEV